MRTAQRIAGFTLIELVLTMVLIGVVAVLAVPRLSPLDSYSLNSATSELLEAIRFAQEHAMADADIDMQVITGGADKYRVREFVHTTGTLREINSPLTGSSPFMANSGEWADITASALNLSFDGRGYPCNSTAPCDSPMTTAQTIALSVAGESRTITIEAITGYAHAN